MARLRRRASISVMLTPTVTALTATPCAHPAAAASRLPVAAALAIAAERIVRPRPERKAPA